MIPLERIRPGARIEGLVPGETAEIVAVRRFGRFAVSAIDVAWTTPRGAWGRRLVCRAHQRFLAWADPPELAHRASHFLREPPGPMETIPYEDAFDAREMRRLRLGVIPQEMEEKWFIYLERDTLYLHRSWTGYCVFTVRLRERGDGCEVAEAKVAVDPDRYRRSSDAYEVDLLRFLVRDLVLGQPQPFPIHPGDADHLPAALIAHHVGGRHVSDRMLGIER